MSYSYTSINFGSLFTSYTAMMCSVAKMIASISQQNSNATPGKFLAVQFQLSQTTQIGDSISNLISQLASSANNAIRNFKSG